MTLEVEPFAEEHLAAAGVLLGDRHRRHRAAEPLLPAAYEDADAAGAEIESLWRADGAAGVAGLRDGRLAGYLIGAPRTTDHWGPNGWVEHAGHAAAEPEDVRDLYAALAQAWVDAGRIHHFAYVPASDAGLVDAWFRLSFGQQQAHGVREVDAGALWPDGVRHAEPRDLDVLVELTPLLDEAQAASPAFAVRLQPDDPDELRTEIEEEIARDDMATLVVESGGRIVGSFVLCPVEMSSGVVSLGTSAGPVPPRVGGDAPVCPRDRCRPRAHAGRARLGGGAGLHGHDCGLARGQPLRRALLAPAGLPADIPAPPPPDSAQRGCRLS